MKMTKVEKLRQEWVDANSVYAYYCSTAVTDADIDAAEDAYKDVETSYADYIKCKVELKRFANDK